MLSYRFIVLTVVDQLPLNRDRHRMAAAHCAQRTVDAHQMIPDGLVRDS